MSTRVIDDGVRAGWGLVALIVTIYGVMMTTAGAIIAWTWKRRSTRRA